VVIVKKVVRKVVKKEAEPPKESLKDEVLDATVMPKRPTGAVAMFALPEAKKALKASPAASPEKPTASSAPPICKDPGCNCAIFRVNPFKKGQCAGCFHVH
jgi:hypothetical protein